MRNAECIARPSSRSFRAWERTFHFNSAFRIPHSALGPGHEGAVGGRRHRRPSHPRTRAGAGAARCRAERRTAARRRQAWHRGRAVAASAVPPSPPADRADLSARLVAQRALAVARAPRVARRGSAVARGAAGDRHRDRRLRRGADRAARAARWYSHRAGRGERVPRTHHPVAGARRAPGAPRVSRSARAAVTRCLHRGVHARQPSAAQAAALARYAVPERVVVRGFFDSMTEPYRAADLVVSRAGAMTVAELCAWGKPSILVPLPTAAANHQTHNAHALAAAGAALFLAEHDLTAHALAQLIGELLGDPARLASLAARARARGHPNASRAIVPRILTLVPR